MIYSIPLVVTLCVMQTASCTKLAACAGELRRVNRAQIEAHKARQRERRGLGMGRENNTENARQRKEGEVVGAASTSPSVDQEQPIVERNTGPLDRQQVVRGAQLDFMDVLKDYVSWVRHEGWRPPLRTGQIGDDREDDAREGDRTPLQLFKRPRRLVDRARELSDGAKKRAAGRRSRAEESAAAVEQIRFAEQIQSAAARRNQRCDDASSGVVEGAREEAGMASLGGEEAPAGGEREGPVNFDPVEAEEAAADAECELEAFALATELLALFDNWTGMMSSMYLTKLVVAGSVETLVYWLSRDAVGRAMRNVGSAMRKDGGERSAEGAAAGGGAVVVPEGGEGQAAGAAGGAPTAAARPDWNPIRAAVAERRRGFAPPLQVGERVQLL